MSGDIDDETYLSGQLKILEKDLANKGILPHESLKANTKGS